MTTLKVWVWGDPHLSADKAHGRDSLATAIIDSETDFNDWDISLGLGDFSAGQTFPDAAEGAEVLSQFGALTNHPREAIYTAGGNHDRGSILDPDGWTRTYVDPVGENTATSGVNPANMPYPITGDWSHYKFQVGNLDFIILSDVTRPLTSLRGQVDSISGTNYGGDPGGVIRSESYQRWIDECEDARVNNRMVITGAHYMPRNTTAYTYDGGRTVPGHGPGRNPDMSSYLGYIDDEEHKFLFSEYMNLHPGVCALWCGGHNHLMPGNDPHGRGQHGSWYGTYFVQCANLTAYHGPSTQLYPRSRIFTFTDGSPIVQMQTYFHMSKGTYTKGMLPGSVAITLPQAVQL